MKKKADLDFSNEKERTPRQNRALHLYFQMVADMLNDAGLDMRVFLKESVDIPWSKDTVKGFLWKPLQRVQLQKDSTTDLNTTDPDKILKTLNRHLAKRGIHVPFPSVESIVQAQRERDAGRIKRIK